LANSKIELMSSNNLIATASIILSIAVMLGAFGAHALESLVTAERLETWQTGVLYHFVHGLALFFTGILRKNDDGKLLKWSVYLFISGILIFSGSLYLLVLTDIGLLGAITPLGGISFIAAWLILSIHYFRK